MKYKVYTQSVLSIGEETTLDNLRFPGQGCPLNKRSVLNIHDFCEDSVVNEVLELKHEEYCSLTIWKRLGN